jgi:hypothetical protein
VLSGDFEEEVGAIEMSLLEFVQPDSFSRLKDCIGEVCFDTIKGFRRETDTEIIARLHGFATTNEAREAAAELARDCGALAEDIALAGPNPSQAWDEAIEDDRWRASLSLERLAASVSRCIKLDSKTGRPPPRSRSVAMRRKRFNRSQP